MIIRKLFKFEAAHIVRGCSTERCKHNIHGHSFKVEVFVQSYKLDSAGMVLDFGLFKPEVKAFLDSFDHCYLLWDQENPELIESIKKFNERWVIFPFSPTSENLALFFHEEITRILRKKATTFVHDEGDLWVKAVRVHETDTGYAETEDGDPLLPGFKNAYKLVEYSPQIKIEQIRNNL